MKNRAGQNGLILIFTGCLLLCGCASSENGRPLAATHPSADKIVIRNNAVSLLYDLLGDEQNVSKVLLVKHHSQQLADTIKTISVTARENRRLLELLAKDDSTLNLQALGLPPGEKAARDSEGKSKEHDLLFTSDQEFEFNLLLTQAEALNYGWHLAKVAAENSTDTNEVQRLTTMWQMMENLYREVFRQMRQMPA